MKKLGHISLAAIGGILLLLRLWPHAPLANRVPLSTSVWSTASCSA
jgi:hypothetical protein